MVRAPATQANRPRKRKSSWCSKLDLCGTGTPACACILQISSGTVKSACATQYLTAKVPSRASQPPPCPKRPMIDGRKILDSDCGEFHRHCRVDLLWIQPLCGVSRHWSLGQERDRPVGRCRHACSCGIHAIDPA